MTDSTHIIPIGTTKEWHGVIITMTEDGWRAEVKHNMHRRCRDWDYCKPWIYLITIDTQHHDVPPVPCSWPQAPSPITPSFTYPPALLALYAKPGHPHLFGELAPVLGPDGKPFIDLNAFGKAVDAEILGIPRYYPQLRILERIVMPNHIHMVIRVMERLPEKKPLGFILNKFKSWVNRRFKEIWLGVPASTCMDIKQPVECSQPVQYSQPRAGSTKPGHGPKNPKHGLVFEINFHDRILFREGQLQVMIAYVLDNPRRLWELINNREYFEHIEAWTITMPHLPYGGTKNAGRWWQYYPGDPAALMVSSAAPAARSVLAAQGCEHKQPARLLAPVTTGEGTMTVTFSAIGNRSLLSVPERMQIQCSRKASEADIDALIADTLEACKHGVVPISPCLSPGEKAVARAVMDAGYPLIALFPQGIPPQTDEYKPYGQFFDACARGQLLILSPWEFRPGNKKVERWQCLLLNDLAAQLSISKEP